MLTIAALQRGILRAWDPRSLQSLLNSVLQLFRSN